MGIKIYYTGLLVGLLLNEFIPEARVVGAVLGVIGIILVWLDR